jgi:hypothetical protein
MREREREREKTPAPTTPPSSLSLHYFVYNDTHV